MVATKPSVSILVHWCRTSRQSKEVGQKGEEIEVDKPAIVNEYNKVRFIECSVG